MKRVIVFGSQKIAIECIKNIKKNELNLLCVVGSEMPSDKIYGYSSISEFCHKEKIKYYKPDKLDENFMETIQKLNPDFCFSFYYRKIFNKKLINIPSEGFINIHPSLLPKYRGPVPSMWALLNGDTETGVTLHYIDRGIDSGDIIAKKKVRINSIISGFELHNKLMDEGVSLFQKTLPKIISNKAVRIKQKDEDATYYGPFNTNLLYINWYSKTHDIYNKIRTFRKPYLGARGIIGDSELIVWFANEVDCPKENLKGPGKIIEIKSDNSFIVSTVDGHLLIKKYEFREKETEVKKYIYPGNSFSFWALAKKLSD